MPLWRVPFRVKKLFIKIVLNTGHFGGYSEVNMSAFGGHFRSSLSDFRGKGGVIRAVF